MSPPEQQPGAPWQVQRLIIDPRTWELLLEATRISTEYGGVLIGDRDPTTQTARVLGFLFPRQHIANSTYCAFDMQWVSLTRAALMARNLDQRVTVIAWIHTHPRLSVFLSGTDVGTIDMLQTLNPLTLAVVLDPFALDMGAFHVERYQRDVQIDRETIRLDARFAAELLALLDAPQLATAEVAAVVPSSSLKRSGRIINVKLGAKAGTETNPQASATSKKKPPRQKLPDQKPLDNEKHPMWRAGRDQTRRGFERMHSWLTLGENRETKPLAPLLDDEAGSTVADEAGADKPGGSSNTGNSSDSSDANGSTRPSR